MRVIRLSASWCSRDREVVDRLRTSARARSVSRQHLRNILAYLDVPTLGQPEAFIHVKDGLFDEGGTIANAESKAFLQDWMNRYAAWVKQHAAR